MPSYKDNLKNALAQMSPEQRAALQDHSEIERIIALSENTSQLEKMEHDLREQVKEQNRMDYGKRWSDASQKDFRRCRQFRNRHMKK